MVIYIFLFFQEQKKQYVKTEKNLINVRYFYNSSVKSKCLKKVLKYFFYLAFKRMKLHKRRNILPPKPGLSNLYFIGICQNFEFCLLIFTRIFMNKTQQKQNYELIMYEEDFYEQQEDLDEVELKYTHITDYSMQVNLNDQFLVDAGIQKTKKEKMKEKRQRKKLKKQQKQKTAKLKMDKIIEDIYNNHTKFKDQKQEIEQCLKHLKAGEKFHKFLNNAIHKQVDNIRDNIWDLVSEAQSNEDPTLYLQVVDQVYAEYEKLRETSREIQKVISLFMKMTGTSQLYQEDSDYLDKSTFNFMVENQQDMKILIKDCYDKISEKHTQHREKLNIIYTMISFPNHIYDDEYILEKSTSIDEEDLEQYTTIKPKKKKKKTKQIDFSSDYLDVVHKLGQMVFNKEERKQCYVQNQWIKALADRVNASK